MFLLTFHILHVVVGLCASLCVKRYLIFLHVNEDEFPSFYALRQVLILHMLTEC